MSQVQTKSAFVMIRVSLEEKEALERQAEAHHRTVSNYLRFLIERDREAA